MSLEQINPDNIPPAAAAPIAEVRISDEVPLDTAQLREHPVFLAADPEGRVPDVTLGSAPLNPRDRAHVNEQRIGIMADGQLVGALNLKQLPSGTTWIRDVRIEKEAQGRRLGVATYLGVIATAHDVGRRVQSDPAGLSPSPAGDSPASHVWASLVRRGVAEVVPGQQDQHGNPRFISKPPEK
jgi:hypothetical protein